MEFVKVEWGSELHGFSLESGGYLSELSNIRESLPPGAPAFASDPAHYSFGSDRCVKDLELVEFSVPSRVSREYILDFAANKWKHASGLRIRDSGVTRFSIDYDEPVEWMQAETVLIDEILPHGDGFRHEIALTDATITVHCADLEASWGDREA
ncbi:hypothetical protein ABZ746_33875 [Streptomyces sp. NPDC020096]